jgi:putative ABC transport system permease protein
MLGIVIGVLSVIVLIGLGQASQAYITNQVQGLGAGMLMVTPGGPKGQGALGGTTAGLTLTVSDAKALEDVPGVTQVAPTSFVSQILKVGKTTVGGQVMGTTPFLAGLQGFELAEGRFFNEQEARTGARVIVLGDRLAKDLFAGRLEPALGAKVQLEQQRLRVIGVLAAQGGISKNDANAYIPIRTFQSGLREGDYVNVIYLRAASDAALEPVKQRVGEVLRQRHGIRADEEDDFSLQTMAELLKTITVVTQGFTVLLAGIAALSLLVGGVGIMNIMLVSVTERTREIGVRKALGAKRRDIMIQFLIEGATISLAGGTIGIALGLALTWAITRAASLPFVLSPEAVIGGFAFSAAVGIFFGLYPANKAASLAPVDALRYE